MRIAVEGMDGSGKTTLSKILADRLGYKYVDKPFKFLFDTLNINESQLKDLEWKIYETEDEALLTLFYGLGILYGTRCDLTQNIIYDRHFVSNYYWHGNDETMSLHQELIKLCGEPDLTVLLKASVSTRIDRIHNRDAKDKDLSNCAIYDYGYDKMEQFLLNSGFNYIVVDTEHLSPEEIADIVMKKIDLNKQKKLIKERK